MSSSGVSMELPPHLRIVLIPVVTFEKASTSLVIGSSSLAPCAALMMACSPQITGISCCMSFFATSNLDIMTPLAVLISATAIDSELSMTQSVFWTLDVSILVKNPNPTRNIPTIRNITRMSRFWGDIMKLRRGSGILYFYFMLTSLSPGCRVHWTFPS